jgi:hypothetical protein
MLACAVFLSSPRIAAVAQAGQFQVHGASSSFLLPEPRGAETRREHRWGCEQLLLTQAFAVPAQSLAATFPVWSTAAHRRARRGDMREKRRRPMADWSTYCESPPAAATGKVVPMRA